MYCSVSLEVKRTCIPRSRTHSFLPIHHRRYRPSPLCRRIQHEEADHPCQGRPELHARRYVRGRQSLYGAWFTRSVVRGPFGRFIRHSESGPCPVDCHLPIILFKKNSVAEAFSPEIPCVFFFFLFLLILHSQHTRSYNNAARIPDTPLLQAGSARSLARNCTLSSRTSPSSRPRARISSERSSRGSRR